MDKDTREELERLEKELLADLPEAEQISEDDLLSELELEEIFAEHADPAEAPDDAAYSNYSSDYSDELQEFADNGGEEPKKHVFGDKLTIGLMLTVCALCVGIIAVLIYWMEAFL